MTIKRCLACRGALSFNYPGPVYCSETCRQGANALARLTCTCDAHAHRLDLCQAHNDRRFERGRIRHGFDSDYDDDWWDYDYPWGFRFAPEDYLLGVDQLLYWPTPRTRRTWRESGGG